MAESHNTPIIAETHVTRKRVTWKMIVLTLLGLATIFAAWCVPIHIHYRRQMQAIAVVEQLGGSVYVRYDAPEWLQRLEPDVAFGGIEGIGPNWFRGLLPAKKIVDHFLVVETVHADDGPGAHIVSDYSGQHRDVYPIKVTDDDLACIARFTRLENLYLRHMPISDAGLKHLRDLRHIRQLYLSFTDITDDSAEILAGFEKLERLRLVGTRISDVGIAKLSTLRHLEELDVRKTQVTGKGLDPYRGRPGLSLMGNGADDPSNGVFFSY